MCGACAVPGVHLTWRGRWKRSLAARAAVVAAAVLLLGIPFSNFCLPGKSGWGWSYQSWTSSWPSVHQGSKLCLNSVSEHREENFLLHLPGVSHGNACLCPSCVSGNVWQVGAPRCPLLQLQRYGFTSDSWCFACYFPVKILPVQSEAVPVLSFRCLLSTTCRGILGFWAWFLVVKLLVRRRGCTEQNNVVPRRDARPPTAPR